MPRLESVGGLSVGKLLGTSSIFYKYLWQDRRVIGCFAIPAAIILVWQLDGSLQIDVMSSLEWPKHPRDPPLTT